MFWLFIHVQQTTPGDRNAAIKNAVTILNQYAGQSIPKILTHYAADDNCFRAAIDALLHFDNYDATNENERSSAAIFLSHYQDDNIFKAQLVKHGARLIPASRRKRTLWPI